MTERNLIDHPCVGDRYEWRGQIINVCAAPMIGPGGYRVPIMVLVDGRREIWLRSPWLKMHRNGAVLLRTTEQFIEQIETSGRPALSVLK